MGENGGGPVSQLLMVGSCILDGDMAFTHRAHESVNSTTVVYPTEDIEITDRKVVTTPAGLPNPGCITGN